MCTDYSPKFFIKKFLGVGVGPSQKFVLYLMNSPSHASSRINLSHQVENYGVSRNTLPTGILQ